MYKYLDLIDLPYLTTVLSVGYLYYGSDKYYLTSKSEEPLRVINEKVKENINSDTIKPLDNVLGHYYRQMFHIVKYVASTEWLNENEKYEYIKWKEKGKPFFENEMYKM